MPLFRPGMAPELGPGNGGVQRRSRRPWFRVSGLGFWVLGLGFRVLGFGFWVVSFGVWV